MKEQIKGVRSMQDDILVHIAGQIPAGFDIITLPESDYLMFQGECGGFLV